eukprot:14958-Alexandrium_andersonii.AAC.1
MAIDRQEVDAVSTGGEGLHGHKTTRGDIEKLYGRHEASAVLDLEKRPWKAQRVGGALFTWNGD